MALVVEKAAKRIKPLADKKKIGIKIDLEKDVRVRGDGEMLTDLVSILLDNAVKYSKQNKTVRVDLKESKNRVRVNVSDQGIGIAKHHLDHIFDRFYRVDSARSKLDDGGHGLGLSVAKKVVEQYGGKISVKSEVGKGSEFAIVLPKI